MAKTIWKLDTSHSEVTFKVRHMMISTVSGSFGVFDAKIETEDTDFTQASIVFTIEVNSISTQNEQRDAHLRSADFFETEKYPHIIFEAISLEKLQGDNYLLQGNLSIKNQTKKVSFHVEHGGTIKDMYGLIRSGFSIEGSINRKEFGLNWNALTEAGGLVVADEVKIYANIELTMA